MKVILSWVRSLLRQSYREDHLVSRMKGEYDVKGVGVAVVIGVVYRIEIRHQKEMKELNEILVDPS
jgi:pyridoxal biosynthesis lyase PdxS